MEFERLDDGLPKTFAILYYHHQHYYLLYLPERLKNRNRHRKCSHPLIHTLKWPQCLRLNQSDVKNWTLNLGLQQE